MVNEKPMEGLFGMLFSRNLVVLGILFGLLFVWLGNIIFTFSFPPTSSDITGFKVAFFLNSFGYAAITMFLIGGGISNKKFDKLIRMVMIISGVIVLVMTLVISLSSLLALISPYG
jgi:predicted MFS family arabinose efflux permease